MGTVEEGLSEMPCQSQKERSKGTEPCKHTVCQEVRDQTRAARNLCGFHGTCV